MHSIGTPASRWLTIVTSATASAPSRASTSSPNVVAKQTFEPCSGNRIGASGASAAAAVVTAGQRVVVDDDGLGGVDGLLARLGDDGGDDVADEAHACPWRRPAG